MSENVNPISGELVSVEDAADFGVRTEIANLASGAPAMFSSITGTDFKSRVAVVNAMSKSSPVSEHLNKKIMLKDVIIQAVALENEQTGQVQDQPRIVLIDDKGNAYHAISAGLFTSVKNILGVLGHPASWPEAVPVTIVKAGTGTRQYFTAQIG